MFRRPHIGKKTSLPTNKTRNACDTWQHPSTSPPRVLRDSERNQERYQFDSRSGVAVMLWIERSAPSDSCSGSRRMPIVAFNNP